MKRKSKILTVKSNEIYSRAQNILSIFRAEAGSLISLAVPLIAGILSSVVVGLTDTFFLGPLGEEPLAAVSLTTSVAIILYAALYGLLGPVGYLVGTTLRAAMRPKSRKSWSTACGRAGGGLCAVGTPVVADDSCD